MNQQIALPTDEDRQMVRESVQGFLGQHWPADKAIALADQPDEISKVWRMLGEQGVITLGTDPSEGGLREILIVMEELGRASCPAPMLGAALANTALWPMRDSSELVTRFMDQLHQGNASVCVAFGAYDGDADAGRAEVKGGRLSGQVNYIEGAANGTHMLVFVEQGPAVALVDLKSPGVSVTPTPGLGVPALSRITLKETQAAVIPLNESTIRDLNLLFRLCLTVRARGAANRAFKLVTEYAKERCQFGQPIGRFQAIQHKLANCLMSLDGVLLTVDHAATCYDQNQDDWRVFASAACAFASPALRQVSLETHHTFGAIGYAEEHEAPRHFRRVHSDLVRCGGVLKAREELAEYLLGPA